MTSEELRETIREELRETIREAKAAAAEDPHGAVYLPPAIFKDGAARCRCGWESKMTTPGRATAAWRRHREATSR